MDRALAFSEEVQAALDGRRPVVALETTILSHGMPYPDNLETARALEQIVRDEGAVPATIAVIGGRVRIGVSKEQLEHVAVSRNVLKLSRGDLAFALASGEDGATTVAATMLCADLAGIAVFATGGIGGVHRGVEETMDISADIEELARTPVCVVCAGAKALLDLPKTLEALETRGVPVIGYRTREFPAFWSARSGLPISMHFDHARDIARYLRLKGELDLGGGTLVVNPIPVDDEIPADEMERYVDRAVGEAREKRIGGKALTPWLLDRVLQLSEGKSLRANVALVKNNARLAARIACALV